METIRLQKYLARCGAASRRKCEEMIAAGRVCVNGRQIVDMGVRVSPEDVVTLDGNVMRPEARLYYLAYHKPYGEVSTVSDPQGRPTVLDRFGAFPARVYPVGRLDFDSEGLILLTNDGDLAQRLLHPSHEVDKTYRARVSGNVADEALAALRSGVMLDGRATAPAKVRVAGRTAVETVLLLTIHEGRNRQVRRMLEAVGHRVLSLRREAFGPLSLGALKRGQYRELTEAELQKLKGL